MIPGQVLALIMDTPSVELPGSTTDQHECTGTKFHSPRPMVVSPFVVRRSGSGDEIVYLCGTCADNVRVLLTLLRHRQGEVPWAVRRCFGNTVRDVALAAYRYSAEETSHA